MSSRRGWCRVGVSPGVPKHPVPTPSLVLTCGVMTCSCHPSPALAQSSNNDSFIIVFLVFSTGLGTQKTMNIHLLDEQMNEWMKASLSHCKNIPYFTPAVLNPGYMRESRSEISEDPQTQAIPPEIQTPVAVVGPQLLYFFKTTPGIARVENLQNHRAVAEVRE